MQAIRFSAAIGFGCLLAAATMSAVAPASARGVPAGDERLAELLALHDVRTTLHAPAVVQTNCAASASEEER